MEVYGGASKKNPFGLFAIGLVLFIWFALPLISFAGLVGGLPASIVALMIMVFVIKKIVGKFKNIDFNTTALDRAILKNKTDNHKDGNVGKVEIPYSFANQGTSFSDLFSSRRGREIIYYDNGKPVYKK
jgi:hypothetical protein